MQPSLFEFESLCHFFQTHRIRWSVVPPLYSGGKTEIEYCLHTSVTEIDGSGLGGGIDVRLFLFGLFFYVYVFWFVLLTCLSTLDALYIGGPVTLFDFFSFLCLSFYPRDVYVLFIRESSIGLTDDAIQACHVCIPRISVTFML